MSTLPFAERVYSDGTIVIVHPSRAQRWKLSVVFVLAMAGLLIAFLGIPRANSLSDQYRLPIIIGLLIIGVAGVSVLPVVVVRMLTRTEIICDRTNGVLCVWSYTFLSKTLKHQILISNVSSVSVEPGGDSTSDKPLWVIVLSMREGIKLEVGSTCVQPTAAALVHSLSRACGLSESLRK